MSEIYLILVVVLFALAISDLIVGVSNDAVNFLNSAIGSKAAPKWMIFGVASLGVLVGSAFSSGMMEVARKGIFNPEMFFFSEIIIIFLAVMITDVILLDTFNSLGMPTSTTVSVVFELLGSAVSVALVKMAHASEATTILGNYINSDRALLIIFGILLSVVIAFSVGALIQWLTRVLFSFRYDKRFKIFGAMYGGIAIAAITYFMIIKGAKGASFLSTETVAMLKDNMMFILIISFGAWTLILQLLLWIFKIDILKIIVLVGTFALAMAFAGNDLVNFIGVPLAGLESFKTWSGSGIAPDVFTMESLANKVETPTFMLIAAGLVMVVTLITSRKAKNVVKTSIDLSRQNEGEERFGSSAIARLIVRSSVRSSEFMDKVMPAGITQRLSRQFKQVPVNNTIAIEDQPAFDKIRAASNLIVASILISIGTSLKLPLSTTYVTFMVAMGTSLADKAWGRESAVYRISGVFAVIGGWFLTALIAFTVSFIVARIMMVKIGDELWGQFITTGLLVVVAGFVVIRTQIRFRRKSKEEDNEIDDEITDSSIETNKVLEKCNKTAVKAIISTSKAYFLCFEGFFNNDRQQLKNAVAESAKFSKKAKKQKNGIYSVIEKLQQGSTDIAGHYYVQVIDYLREMAHSVSFIVGPVHTHFENNHKPFNAMQIEELTSFGVKLNDFFNETLHVLKEEKYDNVNELILIRDALLDELRSLEKNQIRRIKKGDVSTRNSMLYFNVISETKTLLLNLINLVKAQRDFIVETQD